MPNMKMNPRSMEPGATPGEMAKAMLQGWRRNMVQNTVLKLILSKSIGRGYTWQRVLNGARHYNSQPDEDERENFFVGIIGYDRLIGPDIVLVVDFVREQEKEEDQDSNLLEVGVRYQLTPLVVLTAGAAAGIGEDSPDFRTILGFQKSFQRGWSQLP